MVHNQPSVTCLKTCATISRDAQPPTCSRCGSARGSSWLASPWPDAALTLQVFHRRAQVRHRAVNIGQFVEAKQADSERTEIIAFIALQRHTGRDLQTERDKLLAGLHIRVVGVTDDDTRRFKSGCRSAEN